ncbi:MAG: rRNA pseudouridine synthase, partial [Actinomycetota bacterium]|nr:rRNA pseudouridine synthase [Actinomycetota bacterium]
ALESLAAGPALEDGRMHPPELANLKRAKNATTLDITIHEGRNRIIRRACSAVGLHLVSLHRTRVGPVTLGDLPEGGYRPLTPSELEALR